MNQNKIIIPKTDNKPINFVEITGLNFSNNMDAIIKTHRKLV